MTKTTKTTKTNFTRTTIAPNLEQTAPTNYRARVTVKGTRHSNNFTNKAKALKWIKLVKETNDLNVTV